MTLPDVVTAPGPADNTFARAVMVLRNEGLGIFWIKLVSGLGLYRRLVMHQRLLDSAVPDFPALLPLRIELLKEGDVDDYLALRPDATRARIVDQLRAGHLCFVARHDGRVVSTCWATTHRAWSAFLNCDIDLSVGDAYLFDAFTDPHHRGQRVAPALCHHQLQYLQRAGSRRAIRATAVENKPAMRAHAKSGFRPTSTLGRLKIGPWQRFFRRPWPTKDQSP